MSRPQVTAIIPTTGRPSVRRAAVSALRQSAGVQVLVVLDDPHSFTHVKRRLEGLSCSVVQTPGGRGRAAARNIGVQFAETPYVAFLEDCDEWVTEKTGLQLHTAAPETAVSSRAMLVGASSRIVPDQLYDPGQGSMADYVVAQPPREQRHHHHQTSALLCSRRAALATPWREYLPRYQDWDWLIRLQASGITVLQRPEVLVKVTQTHQGLAAEKSMRRAYKEWLRGLRGAEATS